MSDGIIGALVGGLIALLGVWLTYFLERRGQAKSLRATLLAELEAARDALRERDPLLESLENWEKSGTATWARLMSEALDIEPSAGFPVYYARAGDLGLLSAQEASAVISHYAAAVGLLRSSRLILAAIPLDGDTSGAARHLRKDYLKMLGSRDLLIAKLRRIPHRGEDDPVRTAMHDETPFRFISGTINS